MSPRAAWRLESLGFGRVYDYAAGKEDWLAAGLPSEGTATTLPRIARVARTDVPTCLLRETIGEARARAGGWGLCIVVNEDRVVLGILRGTALDGDASARAEDVMTPGPSTFRPHVPVEEMAHYMEDNRIRTAIVTSSDGRLVGFLHKEDLDPGR